MKDIYSERKGQTPLLAEKRDRQGLCTFCAATAHCVLIDPSGMPVLQCEEFRTILPAERRIIRENGVLGTGPSEVPPSEHVDHSDWGKKGLCGNCALYNTCPFSKNEGGVWHCEEYR